MDIDKEELKNETKETVNQVKDSFKNVDVSQEAKATHGFLKGMFVEPFETVERVANGEEEVFKRSIVLLIIHVALAFLVSVFGYHYGNILNRLKDLILDVIAPVVAILVPAVIIVLTNKSNKKPATTVISTLVVARVPIILSAAVSVVRTLLPRIALIANPISSTLSAIAMVLTFVGMKTLYAEDKKTFLAKFAIVEFITYLVLYLI